VDRPLIALFVDCDSFFASVEQHLDPALRGRPVGVAPVMGKVRVLPKSNLSNAKFPIDAAAGANYYSSA
jgi:DNA polymerase-4